MSLILGFDVGGTSIKGAVVDIKKGELVSDRVKYATPVGARPNDVALVVKQIQKDLKSYKYSKIGFGFPSIIKDKICCSASNIHDSWIGKNLFKFFEDATGYDTTVINDADAAGLAELYFGRLSGKKGTLILLTIGTGIGSALFYNGKLIPNTELGHIEFKGVKAEKYLSNKIRKEQELSYQEFGLRLNELLKHIDFVFSPKLIVIGGGVSKRFEEFKSYLDPSIKVLGAKLFNNAGNIGAALSVLK